MNHEDIIIIIGIVAFSFAALHQYATYYWSGHHILKHIEEPAFRLTMASFVVFLILCGIFYGSAS